MSNSPFEPKPPLFPWYAPPTPPSITPSFATLFGTYLNEPARPRVFVSYQHSSDQPYYDFFSKTFHDNYELLFDNSLRGLIRSDSPDYVIQRIRDDFITNTSCTIVLIGPTTHQRKYVDWEIKATLDKEHGLIGLQLPNVVPDYYGRVFVPTRFNANIDSGFALWQGFTWQQIIANPAMLKQLIHTATNREKRLIINPKEIKKQNG